MPRPKKTDKQNNVAPALVQTDLAKLLMAAAPTPGVNLAKRKKTGGRQKGTPNKYSAMVKETISELVGDFFMEGMNSNATAFRENFSKLDFETQFYMIAKLLPVVVAKQTESKITLDEEQMKAVKEASDKINDIFKKYE